MTKKSLSPASNPRSLTCNLHLGAAKKSNFWRLPGTTTTAAASLIRKLSPRFPETTTTTTTRATPGGSTPPGRQLNVNTRRLRDMAFPYRQLPELPRAECASRRRVGLASRGATGTTTMRSTMLNRRRRRRRVISGRIVAV